MPNHPPAPVAFRLSLSTVAALADLLARADGRKGGLPRRLAASIHIGLIRTKRLRSRRARA
jgi:hypothetical protein